MTNFILNLANGWTVLDILIMTLFCVLWLRSKKQVSRKERLLEFADIAKSQMKDDYRKEIVELKAANEILQINLAKIDAYISHLIDRPKVNGKFVKKDYKKPIAYKAIRDVHNSSELSVFTANMQYPVVTESPLTLIGDDGNKYVIDNKVFEPVY